MMTQSKGGQGRGGGELDDNKGGERLEDECCRSCNARKFGARALKQAEQEAQSNCRCYVVYILVRKEFS